MNKSDFYTGAEQFFKELRKDCLAVGLELESSWDIDHVCYRTASLSEYEELKKDFSVFGEMLIESPVGGRAIATFKLTEPLTYLGRKIELVELPAPKVGKVIESGFEHIEVVAPVSFETLMTTYSHLTLDRKGLEKDFNAELEVVLGKRNIKFHQLSLESVIRLEKNEKVMSALMVSGVLRDFRECRPLVVGTYPLGLDVSGSDVDILFGVKDFDVVAEKLKRLLGGELGFEIVVREESLVCRFSVEGVLFEIYGEELESVEQMGYRHFRVEEHLLKYRGVRDEVMKLREGGVKTEEAFAKVLGIGGDVFEGVAGIEVEFGEG
jgi:predicted metalloenzyme YecM